MSTVQSCILISSASCQLHCCYASKCTHVAETLRLRLYVSGIIGLHLSQSTNRCHGISYVRIGPQPTPGKCGKRQSFQNLHPPNYAINCRYKVFAAFCADSSCAQKWSASLSHLQHPECNSCRGCNCWNSSATCKHDHKQSDECMTYRGARLKRW